MFKKKNIKDQLSQVISKNGQQYIYTLLDSASLLNLSLTAKKYYLILAPYFSTFTNNIQQQKKVKLHKPKIKSKKNELKQVNNQNIKHQIQVDIDKIPFWKAKKLLQKSKEYWKRINQLPFQNNYLQKKLQNSVAFFYQNSQTKQIIFINRSIVDPNLNYNQGGFQGDQLNETFYDKLFEDNLNQIDFTSHQALLNRQKQVLSRISKKKQQIKRLQQINYEDQLMKLNNYNKIAVILCFGGSFSFGIYQNNKCVLHKSDKKYVCRKKAGQRQFNRDKNSGQNIKSMGSQIRRDQQKLHQANVGKILTQNKNIIQECDLVFLQAPGFNRLFIINDNQTLSGCKQKLRSVCLTAKKANYTQVQTLYNEISKVNFVKERVKK